MIYSVISTFIYQLNESIETTDTHRKGLVYNYARRSLCLQRTDRPTDRSYLISPLCFISTCMEEKTTATATIIRTNHREERRLLLRRLDSVFIEYVRRRRYYTVPHYGAEIECRQCRKIILRRSDQSHTKTR